MTALVLLGTTLLSSCSSTEDLVTFNDKMFNTSMSSFINQEMAKWAEVAQVPITCAQLAYAFEYTGFHRRSGDEELLV